MTPARRTIEPVHKIWFVKLNNTDGSRALWLKFAVLTSHNGFKQVAETWAVFFNRAANRDIQKAGFKQTYDLKAFHGTSPETGPGIQVGPCVLSQQGSNGTIQSKGRTIQWDLKFQPRQDARFDLIPEVLTRLKLFKSRSETPAEDLEISGTTTIDGEEFHWERATGMMGFRSQPLGGNGFVWSHCNSFVDSSGKPADLVFEGCNMDLPGRRWIPLPRVRSFFFLYGGKKYDFNTVWSALHSRSKSSLTEWKFQVDQGELSFRGLLKAQHRDFAGLTLEDTSGSLFYCASSKLSDLEILVYRSGKLEARFRAPGTAAFEVVGHSKSPYVASLL